MPVSSAGLVPETILDTFRTRAVAYDRENRFFQEDFDELKAAGYLLMAVPREFGGLGITLAQVARETRRVATYAPATALCINMHNYWVGDAADPWRSRRHIGRVDAARSGRGRSLRGRSRRARQRHPGAALDDKGRTRRRRLAFHRTQGVRQPDASVDPPRRPRDGRQRSGGAEDRPCVHASRHEGLPSRKRGTCSACARRAATTRCSRARSCPIKYIARVVPAGAAGVDRVHPRHLHLGADRLRATSTTASRFGVRDLIVEQLKSKTSIALTRPMRYHPEIQHGIAEIAMDLEAMGPQLERVATRLVRRARATAGLADQDRRGEVPRRRSRVSAWPIGARSVGRVRYVQEERAGAAVPRLPRRSLPSGQPAADPRDPWQDDAGDQP